MLTQETMSSLLMFKPENVEKRSAEFFDVSMDCPCGGTCAGGCEGDCLGCARACN